MHGVVHIADLAMLVGIVAGVGLAQGQQRPDGGRVASLCAEEVHDAMLPLDEQIHGSTAA